jgi:hypothetical protein
VDSNHWPHPPEASSPGRPAPTFAELRGFSVLGAWLASLRGAIASWPSTVPRPDTIRLLHGGGCAHRRGVYGGSDRTPGVAVNSPPDPSSAVSPPTSVLSATPPTLLGRGRVTRSSSRFSDDGLGIPPEDRKPHGGRGAATAVEHTAARYPPTASPETAPSSALRCRWRMVGKLRFDPENTAAPLDATASLILLMAPTPLRRG